MCESSHHERNCSPPAVKWVTASPTELSSCTFCFQVAPVKNSCLWSNLFLQRGRKKCTGTPFLPTPTLDCPLDNRMLLGPRVATPKDKKETIMAHNQMDSLRSALPFMLALAQRIQLGPNFI